MKRVTPLILAAAASALMLSACASDMGGRHYADGYDTYYDGYYGDNIGGYWDGDAFYYHGHDGFVRDDGNHYHHQHFDGGRGFRADPRP